MLGLSCSITDGYRKKRGRGETHQHSGGSDAQQTAGTSQESAVLLERAYDGNEVKTKSLNLEQSVQGKSPRRRALPAFSNPGNGKCLSCGNDPRHIYKHGQGRQCEQLCRNEGSCCAYSTSRYGNCLLWTQCEGLTAGGDDWGGAKCHVKPGFGNTPCPPPTPRPTPVPVPTAQPTEEPTEPPCPNAEDVEFKSKTQQCIKYTADFEEVVIASECCQGSMAVADKLEEEKVHDDGEDDVIIECELNWSTPIEVGMRFAMRENRITIGQGI